MISDKQKALLGMVLIGVALAILPFIIGKGLGNAWVRQGTDEVTSERLVYDRRNQRILASGDGGSSGRVRITIQPRSSSEGAP